LMVACAAVITLLFVPGFSTTEFSGFPLSQ
jgi:hypothetical protein